MGWETRGSNRYYYRKRRVGKRVISEYVGSGLLAEMQADQDTNDQTIRANEREAQQRLVAEQRAMDAQLDQLEGQIKSILSAHLLVAGYHQSKGIWRKLRHGKHPDNSQS